MAEKNAQKNVTIMLVIGLLLIVVLLAVAAILSKIFNNGNNSIPDIETPSSSENLNTAEPSSEEPEPEPEPTIAPPAEDFTFTSLLPADGTFAGCESTFGTQEVEIIWESTGAERAYLGINTNNAKDEPLYNDLPPSGSQLIDFPCSFSSSIITVTIENSSGDTISKSTTLTN